MYLVKIQPSLRLCEWRPNCMKPAEYRAYQHLNNTTIKETAICKDHKPEGVQEVKKNG